MLLRLAVGLKSLSQGGWPSGRKAGVKQEKKQGQTGTHGDTEICI